MGSVKKTGSSEAENRRRQRGGRTFLYAATLALALVLGFSASILVNRHSEAKRLTEVVSVSTEAGQRSTVTLPDGTSVLLNSASSLDTLFRLQRGRDG